MWALSFSSSVNGLVAALQMASQDPNLRALVGANAVQELEMKLVPAAVVPKVLLAVVSSEVVVSSAVVLVSPGLVVVSPHGTVVSSEVAVVNYSVVDASSAVFHNPLLMPRTAWPVLLLFR
jgi:hypothetical protein